MKVAVILGNPEKSFMSKLCVFFTGCPAYHVGFVDETTNLIYDMSWLRRRRRLPRYQGDTMVLFDMPCVTCEYLEEKLTTDDSDYGFVDYLKFSLRPIYHLFGKSTRNANGVICSEMLNNDIIACGGETPFSTTGEPPSPCDIFRWLLHK